MRLRLAARTFVSLAAAVAAASVLAQTHSGRSLDVLDPGQFSIVYTPDEMNLLEKFGWAGRVITGHPDTKAIVPTYSYYRDEICKDYNSSSLNALLLTQDGIEAGSLAELCDVRDGTKVPWSDVDWAPTFQDVASSKNVLLLPDQLDHGELSEYWLRCRESSPPAEGSACHETFRLSPYDFHQRLAAGADS